MASQPVHYIPAGCVSLIKADRDIIHDSCGSDIGCKWKWLNLESDEKGGALTDTATQGDNVIIDSRLELFKDPDFISIRRLLQQEWIKLEVLLTDQGGTLRVHLLPDDKLRAKIDRSVSLLNKARYTLLRSLDYSNEAWNGDKLPAAGSHTPFDEVEESEGDGESLLNLFNRIPSPDPDPSMVLNPEARMCMHSLLASKVDGLRSTLYDYQRRSAALMLQKEAEPGVNVDPRLISVDDRHGGVWYLDPVAGSVLSEPRYYDGVRGGILAEEMGSGKTVITLALIMATRLIQVTGPDIHGVPEPRRRPKVGSLMDMAASSANRNGVPWRYLMGQWSAQSGFDDENCIRTLDDLENYGYYNIPAPELRRGCRRPDTISTRPPKKIYLGGASIVIVPNNLLYQWRDEIKLHTQGLRVLTLGMQDEIPPAHELLRYELLLFSQNRFEAEVRLDNDLSSSPLSHVHFRRCVVDEGHKLGNSRISHRSLLLTGVDALHVSARWIVTGTPSHGLFGVKNEDGTYSVDNDDERSNSPEAGVTPTKPKRPKKGPQLTSTDLERKDLDRIGAIAALYLKARPWANTALDTVDTVANWNTYLMLPKHGARSYGRQECLKSTLNSLIIRHKIDEVGELLPPVDEKVVILDGSWYDRLSLNIFSMMIILNAVQSQRTDRDYFFHHKQRQSLLQIVKNLKMSTFFGGSFFTTAEISKSVETAEEFLREGKVPISAEDRVMLQDAMGLGRLATTDNLRHLSNLYHEMPVCVTGFPGLGSSSSWGLSGSGEGDSISTISSLILSLQKTIYAALGKPEEFNALLNGGLERKGQEEKQQIQQMAGEEFTSKKDQTLAGNTKLGDDQVWKPRMHGVNNVKPREFLSSALEPTKVTATVSAKLSYLLDSIVKHQEQEKMIIFYEHENTAWYIAGMLDVVSLMIIRGGDHVLTEQSCKYNT